jgi:hypothetical protein
MSKIREKLRRVVFLFKKKRGSVCMFNSAGCSGGTAETMPDKFAAKPPYFWHRAWDCSIHRSAGKLNRR